jgi:tyrosine-specific transport protein
VALCTVCPSAVQERLAVLCGASAAVATYGSALLHCHALAGTYGVLTLFGIQPAAMAWSARYGSNSSMQAQQQIVPGGKVVLLAVGGAATGVILNEVVQLLSLN